MGWKSGFIPVALRDAEWSVLDRMSTIARIAPPPPPAIANVASARLTGARPVPQAGAGPVDQTAPNTDISFDAAFEFSTATEEFEFGQEFSDGGQQQQSPDLGRGTFIAPSETFAQIVENEIAVDGGTGRADEGPRARSFAGLVNQAINTYETNAQVITGTLPRTGVSLSISL